MKNLPMSLLLRGMACLLIVMGTGCGRSGSSTNQGETGISQDQARPDGVLATRRPGRPTNTPLRDEDVPPSLPITELIEFSHKATGITGVRPANWTLFSGKKSLQISSSPEAPDGFIVALAPLAEIPDEDVAAASELFFEKIKQNQVDGPEPEIIEEETYKDGSGMLLVHTTGHAQGSTRPFRFTTYAQTTITPEGLLISMAVVPADQFPEQEELIREMVESVYIK